MVKSFFPCCAVFLFVLAGAFAKQLTFATGYTVDAAAITVENVNNIQMLNSLDFPPVNSLSWSPDGEKLAVGTDEGIWIYDLQTGSTTKLEDSRMVYHVTFVGETAMIAADYGDTAILFDANTLKVIQGIPGSIDAISHDGDIYAVAGSDRITLRQLESHELRLEVLVRVDESCEFSCVVQDVAFSSNDQFLVYSSAVAGVENGIIELKTGGKRTSIELGNDGLAFSLDGSTIISWATGPGFLSHGLLFTDFTTGHIVASLGLYSPGIPPVFSHDGRLLIVSGLDDHAPNPDEACGELYFFDLENILSDRNIQKSQALRVEAFAGWVTAIGISRDGRYLAVGEKTGQLSIWGLG